MHLHSTVGSRSTAGLTSRSWCTTPVSGKITPFAVHTRTLTRAAGVSPPWFGEPNAVPRESNIVQRPSNAQSRAAGVSPPWFGNRMLCRENRTLSSGDRINDRERRASARRGSANAHRRTRAPFTSDRQRCVCMCVDDRCIRGNRYHGGLTPPALVLRCECLPANNDFFDAQTRNPKERLASARRGCVLDCACDGYT
jgi:hypothetical protein